MRGHVDNAREGIWEEDLQHEARTVHTDAVHDPADEGVREPRVHVLAKKVRAVNGKVEHHAGIVEDTLVE